jgi:7-cyano-7-deazaguanine synthase
MPSKDSTDVSRSRADAIAVLLSGGLDSAVLLAECARARSRVHPLYVRSGLLWEPEEIAHARRFLGALSANALAPLQVLDCPVTDLYGEHWSLNGRNVPDDHSEDDAVFLPGRNLFLLAKAMMWCHLHGVPVLALGVLGSNPFPDATDGFFAACQQVINEAVGGRVRVERPFANLSKTEVVRRGHGLPLEQTFSCLRPVEGKHCGRCNKCAERRRAFAEANVSDLTEYAGPPNHAGATARREAQAHI